jgi:hypothetical protein
MTQILTAERAIPRRCLRVTYEQLVRDPELTFERICAFLGIAYEQEAVSAGLLRSHSFGPGDHKIRASSVISTSSLGRGASVPVALLPPAGLESINMLNAELGYGAIDEKWQLSPSELRRRLIGFEDQTRLLIALKELIRDRMPDLRVSGRGMRVRLLVEEFDSPRGVLFDPSKQYVGDDNVEVKCEATAIARWSALTALAYDTADMSDLVDRGDIRLGACTEIGVGPEVFRLVDALISGTGAAVPTISRVSIPPLAGHLD